MQSIYGRIKAGDHVLAVYSDKKKMQESCFDFLLPRFLQNQVIVLVSEDLQENDVLRKMRDEWKIDALEHVENGNIIIKPTSEVYLQQGRFDSGRILSGWQELIQNSIVTGKTGMSVFADSGEIFKQGFGRELIKYESMLKPHFDYPVTAICAYNSGDIVDSHKELNELRSHHCLEINGDTASIRILEGNVTSMQRYSCTYCEGCPLEESVGVVNRRWYSLILFSISKHKKIGFNDLLRKTNARPQILSRVLREMEDSGILVRESLSSERPFRVLYSLNPNGEKLVALIKPLMQHAYTLCDKSRCAVLQTMPNRCTLLGKENGILDTS